MRISIRTGLSAIVLACVFVSAGTVHLAWNRVANANSRGLAAMLSRQVATAVREDLADRIGEAEAAFAALRTIFAQHVIDSREADRREFVFLSQLQAQPALSWVAFGWADGSFFGSHKLGDAALEMIEIGGAVTRRTDRYRLYPDDIEFRERRFSDTRYDVRQQDWFTESLRADGPRWFFVNTHPDAKRGAIGFAGPIDVYGRRQGVLAVMIELSRLSRFLSRLEVAGSGAAFILGPDGSIVAGPDPNADEVTPPDFSMHPLLPLIRDVGQIVRDGADGPSPHLRVAQAGDAFTVDVDPLGFRDWRVAVAIPEDTYLGPVEAATMRLGTGLAAFILAVGAASTLVAGRLIARPLRAIAGDLASAEAFELTALEHRPSRLGELDMLSSSLIRMAAGLSAFAKYLPRDLVRTLIAEGIEPTPGGERRPLTVSFADLAGFTGLSERMGEAVVPLVSQFLELAAQAVEDNGGTVDKFIGDAAMAFWGAPRTDPEHALKACMAALKCTEAIARAGLVDDRGVPLRVRIGIQSGSAVVGNVGSATRLNYTAIGDTVNLASRLEGINDVFGTSIIIGEATRVAAGERIAVRELDTIAVYGRTGATALFELLGERAAGEPAAPWVAAYEDGLRLYRQRRWSEAAGRFRMAAEQRGGDRPSALMEARCRELLRDPPADGWQPVHALGSK
jgi:adenylate cyclase